jgi:hypothetical protein
MTLAHMLRPWAILAFLLSGTWWFSQESYERLSASPAVALGRYQVATTPTDYVILDTATGHVWIRSGSGLVDIGTPTSPLLGNVMNLKAP